ncbi:MAG: hypothetical protein CMG13_04395 [Candidatus Marinimicrobia bacterium]|nr:hypothetical protein [Candidatus Neomarinimicrobiota bacterium]
MIKTVFRIAVKFALFKTDGILNFVRKTFFLAVLSLTISVFSLIALDSINNGYKDRLGAKLLKIESDIDIQGDDIAKDTLQDLVDIIESSDVSISIEDSRSDRSGDIKSIPGKYQVLFKEQGILRSGPSAEGVSVVSVDESFLSLANEGVVSHSLYEQFYNSPQNIDKNEAILGFSLKENLGLDIGDIIYLFKASDFLLRSLDKSIEPLVVKGFFKTGNPIEDSHTIIIDNETFFNFFKNDRVGNMKVFLKDSSRQEEIRKLIYDKIDDPIYITTFNQKFNEMSYGLDQVFDIISIIILFFILLSVLNIVSSVNLIVESKSKQIKFLKLTGLKLPYISLIFVFISLMSIIVSFSIGCLLSEFVLLIQNNYQVFSISEDVYMISELIGIIDYGYVFIFFLCLIALGILLSLIFSYKTIYNKVGPGAL